MSLFCQSHLLLNVSTNQRRDTLYLISDHGVPRRAGAAGAVRVRRGLHVPLARQGWTTVAARAGGRPAAVYGRGAAALVQPIGGPLRFGQQRHVPAALLRGGQVLEQAQWPRDPLYWGRRRIGAGPSWICACHRPEIRRQDPGSGASILWQKHPERGPLNGELPVFDGAAGACGSQALQGDQLGTDDSNQWISIGGSYPGALSAWFRVAYPDTTVASLSSSGVVQPVYKFHQFDEQVALATGPSCADVLRLTTEAFEKELTSTNATTVKGLFGAQDLADADFFYMIADAAAMAVQYGHKDIVCDSMVGAFERNNSLVDSFASFTIDMYGSSFGSECFYDTKCLAEDRARWGDGRSWRWQKCSQLAYFQVAPEEKSLRSAMVDLDYHLKQCQTVFGDVVHPSEGVDEITKLYGGDHPNGHKIFFSNGGDDPWQRASVLDTLADDEIANLAKCPLCGHCGDLRADPNVPEPLKKQREQILEYLTKGLGESSDVGVVETTVHESATLPHTQEEDDNEQEMAGLQLAGLHRSSPLVLIPIVVAFLALVGVLHADVVRDAPGGMELIRYRLAHTHEF